MLRSAAGVFLPDGHGLCSALRSCRGTPSSRSTTGGNACRLYVHHFGATCPLPPWLAERPPAFLWVPVEALRRVPLPVYELLLGLGGDVHSSAVLLQLLLLVLVEAVCDLDTDGCDSFLYFQSVVPEGG